MIGIRKEIVEIRIVIEVVYTIVVLNGVLIGIHEIPVGDVLRTVLVVRIADVGILGRDRPYGNVVVVKNVAKEGMRRTGLGV